MASKFNLQATSAQQSFRRKTNVRFPSNYSLNARLSMKDLGAGLQDDLGEGTEVKKKVVYVQDEDDPENLIPKYVASEELGGVEAGGEVVDVR